jgi:hypothetical protein
MKRFHLRLGTIMLLVLVVALSLSVIVLMRRAAVQQSEIEMLRAESKVLRSTTLSAALRAAQTQAAAQGQTHGR